MSCSYEQREYQKSTLLQKAEGRIAHEILMTKDPKLNRVPRERLMEAKSYTKTLLRKKTAIQNINWTERGPSNVSGRTRAILVDSNDPTGKTIWAAGVAGGLWKSTDNADSWTSINDFFENLAICAIAQDPSNPDIIYFGTGEGFGNADGVRGLGIWKSDDGGDSFSHLAATNIDFNFISVQKLVVTENGTLLAATLGGATNGGIMRSIDEGISFTRFQGSGNSRSAADLEIASNGDIYAALGMLGDNDGIYKSTNDGSTWSLVYASASNESRIELATAPSNANVVYALIENRDEGGIPPIIKTTDSGDSWSLLPTPLWYDQGSCLDLAEDWTRTQDWYNLICAVDPNDENNIIIGGVDILMSSDGGMTWNQKSHWLGFCNFPRMHADQHAIIYDGSLKIWFGNDGGVFLSEDGGNSFVFRGEDFNVTQFYAVDISPNINSNEFIGGTQDNGTQSFSSSGINETVAVTRGDGGFCHIDQDNPDFQISSSQNNVACVTIDGWQSRDGTICQQLPGGLFISPMDYDDKLNILYASGSSGTISRWNDSTKLGDDIDVVNVSNLNQIISTIRISPNVSNRIYFGDINGNIYRLDNANTGTSKTAELLFQASGFPSCIEIENGNEDHILITYSNFGVTSIYESIDGLTFNSVEGNLPDMPVCWAAFNPRDSDQALIATELGIWSTTDLNGFNTDWDPTNANLANVRCDMIRIRESDNQMIVGTHGRGVFTASLDNRSAQSIVQIGQDIDGEAPEDFSGTIGISANGKIIAIGASGNDGNGDESGHVRVFQFENEEWIQLGQDIDGETSEDRSGESVSMSDNGSILAIGATGNDGNGEESGHVRVYQLNGNIWTQLGQDIDGEASNDSSGGSTSLSADGNRLAIGARANDGNGDESGHVRVYQFIENSWTQLGQDINGGSSLDRSGRSISLSDDGSIVAIGAELNDGNGDNAGHVRVFQLDGGIWIQRGPDIVGEASGDNAGFKVSLSADGTVVAIGADRNDSNGTSAGSVRVFKYLDDNWTQLGTTIEGLEPGDRFGSGLSISGDGSILAVGAILNDESADAAGHVLVYRLESCEWRQLGLQIGGEATFDLSGLNVRLSSDGSTLAVDGSFNDGNGPESGHVRVFSLGLSSENCANDCMTIRELCDNNIDDDMDGIIDEHDVNEWIGGQGDWYENVCNWSLGYFPTSCDRVIIPSDSKVTVSVNKIAYAHTLDVMLRSDLTIIGQLDITINSQ